MARQILQSLLKNHSSLLPYPLSLLLVLCLLSLITHLCASHRTKKLHRPMEENSPQTPSRLLTKFMEKMVSWRKVNGGTGFEELDNESEEAAVWRKEVIMGGRCRPLDFSGKIVYDSQGNLLVESSKQEKKKSKVDAN